MQALEILRVLVLKYAKQNRFTEVIKSKLNILKTVRLIMEKNTTVVILNVQKFKNEH